MKSTLAGLSAALLLASAAHASSVTLGSDMEGRVALTGNNTSPADWRLTNGLSFNGRTFDGVARLRFDNDGNLSNGAYACSGTLLKGGYFVVTAAHCADDFNVMQVTFGYRDGVAMETRGVTRAHVYSGWTGELSRGADIAILQLDRQVTNIEGFNISTSNDRGKDFLIMGYGTTAVGNSTTAPGWGDSRWGHWGMNTFDATGNEFLGAASAMGLGGLGAWSNVHGEEYVADFDGIGDPARHNTLGRIAGLTSGTGLGANEASITGGDSGGGDFVWDGSEWLLSGVHSWGWQFCGGRLTNPNSCDFSNRNSGSWGDLMGSTAVFSHANWIGVTAVPEPATLAMVPMALLAMGALRRRRQQA